MLSFQICLTLLGVGCVLGILIGGYAANKSSKVNKAPPTETTTRLVQDVGVQLLHVNGPPQPRVQIVSDLTPLDSPFCDPRLDYRYYNRNSQLVHPRHLDSYFLEMDSPSRNQSAMKVSHTDEERPTKSKSSRSRQKYESDSEDEPRIAKCRSSKKHCKPYPKNQPKDEDDYSDEGRSTKTSRRKYQSDSEDEPKVVKGHLSRKQCKPSKNRRKDHDNDDGGFSAFFSNSKKVAKE